MGKVILPLSEGELSEKTIFDKRFVIECCETFHLHWRNLRLELSAENWLQLVDAFETGIAKWRAHGSPRSHPHLELARFLMDTSEIVHPTTANAELFTPDGVLVARGRAPLGRQRRQGPTTSSPRRPANAYRPAACLLEGLRVDFPAYRGSMGRQCLHQRRRTAASGFCPGDPAVQLQRLRLDLLRRAGRNGDRQPGRNNHQF
jgi:hypothetical protein